MRRFWRGECVENPRIQWWGPWRERVSDVSAWRQKRMRQERLLLLSTSREWELHVVVYCRENEWWAQTKMTKSKGQLRRPPPASGSEFPYKNHSKIGTASLARNHERSDQTIPDPIPTCISPHQIKNPRFRQTKKNKILTIREIE